jgi:hypothetical protein
VTQSADSRVREPAYASDVGDPSNLSRSDWEALLQAPLCVYSAMVAVEHGASEAQFRAFRDELNAAGGSFREGSTGAILVDNVLANLEVLFAAHQAAGRPTTNGLKRARSALRRVSDEESEAVGDWLVRLAVRLAAADRVVGEWVVSHDEVHAIREVAKALKRPIPIDEFG